MRVYRLIADVNHYQSFLPEREQDWQRLVFDGTPRSEGWTPPPVFVYIPRHKAGDFYQFSVAALITSPRATEVLSSHLEMAGELLPLPYNGEQFTILNITECIDCLDQAKTKWQTERGVRLWPEKHVFHPDRFSESTLFKIPETCRADVLVAEGLREPKDEFRYAVEQAGLQGLIFEEIWSDGRNEPWSSMPTSTTPRRRWPPSWRRLLPRSRTGG